jgi:hypothetical protein
VYPLIEFGLDDESVHGKYVTSLTQTICPKGFIKEYKTKFTANKEQVENSTDDLFCYIVSPEIYEKYRLT